MRAASACTLVADGPWAEDGDVAASPRTVADAEGASERTGGARVRARVPPRARVPVGAARTAAASVGAAPAPPCCPACAASSACAAVSAASQALRAAKNAQDAHAAQRCVEDLLAGGHRCAPRVSLCPGCTSAPLFRPPRPAAPTHTRLTHARPWCPVPRRANVQVWTRLVSALGSCRLPVAAEAVLARMADAGTPPDAVAYGAVVHAHCLSGSAADAQRVLDLSKERGVVPTEGTYTSLLALYAQQGRLAKAEALLSEMESGGLAPEEAHFNALVRGCLARGDVPAAAAVVSKLHNDAQNMELVSRRGGALLPSARTYGLLVDAYASQGDVPAARKLMEQMRWYRVPPSTAIFNMLIKGFAKAGLPEAADAVLREMAGSGSWDMDALGVSPNAISFSSVADAWAVAARPDKVRGLLNRSLAADVPLDDVSWCILIKAYGRARQPQQAQAVLGEMLAQGTPPGLTCWSAAVNAWCAAEQPAIGEALLDQMAAAGVQPSAVAWNHVIFAHAAGGDVIAAASALKRMRSGSDAVRAVSPGESTRSAWNSGWAEAGLPADASQRAWLRALNAGGPDDADVAAGSAPARVGGTRRREDAWARNQAAVVRHQAQEKRRLRAQEGRLSTQTQAACAPAARGGRCGAQRVGWAAARQLTGLLR